MEEGKERQRVWKKIADRLSMEEVSWRQKTRQK